MIVNDMKIHHIAITVNNLETSKEFYSKYFGFSEIKLFERIDLRGKAIFLQCENIILELWEFSNPFPSQGDELQRIGIRHLAFEVGDIENFILNLPNELITEYVKLGASGGKYLFIKDPSGVNIELYQTI